MPLYLPDEDIDAFSKEVATALREIKRHCADIAVTPAIALSMIRQYIQPLMPKKIHYLLYQQKVMTWNDINEIYYLALDFYISEFKNLLFLEIVSAIEAVYRNTTKTPRHHAISVINIEMRYFLGMCRKLELPIQNIYIQKNKTVDLFSFCKLCWRRPIFGRKFCAHHSINFPFQINNATAMARYKSGMRQKKKFYTTVSSLLAKDVFDFYIGKFTPEVLFPDNGIAAWLIKRRPLVWQLLGEQQQLFTDNNGVFILLNLLHSPDGLPEPAQRSYTLINQHILVHPLLIWPMLLRAEGWLQSRAELRSKWGGKRIGAGRRD